MTPERKQDGDGQRDLDADLTQHLDRIASEEVPERLTELAQELQRLLKARAARG